jgi:biopolymer transport protein ExbB/TolQ
MTMTIAAFIDYFSYVLFAITLALIAFKIIELWFPIVLKNPPLRVRYQYASVEFEEFAEDLEKGLVLLAVIAGTAPFVGLMGTVLHIIAALSKVSTSLDTAIISGPIATALNATLVGLASAVPAAAAHSLFSRRIEVIRQNFERKGRMP